MCKTDYKNRNEDGTYPYTIVMCKKVDNGGFNHYGTEWEEYIDKEGNVYHGRS
jgi:hypothetical protein